LFTEQQDAAEYAQYNSSSGIEKLRNVTKSISDTVKQLPSDFSKCVGLGIFAALNIPTCVANAVTKITNLTSQLKDAIQAAGADTSSAISSFIAINKNATDQYRKIDQETYACVENAVSSSE
jgi:phage-related protein